MFASFNVGSSETRTPYMDGEQGFIFVQREFISVNTAACFTACTFSVLTIGTALLATSAVSEVAMFALALVAVVFAAFSIASISAWFDKDSTTLDRYYTRLQNHVGIAVTAILQIGVQTVINGLCQRLEDRISGRRGFNIN